MAVQPLYSLGEMEAEKGEDDPDGSNRREKMTNLKAKIRALEKIAYAPYERIEKPTTEDWKKRLAYLSVSVLYCGLCGWYDDAGRY